MASFDTGFPADSLEFCPSPLASDIVACGTYKLDNDTFSAENERTNQQHRRGQCLIFRAQSNETSDKLSMYAFTFALNLKIHQTVVRRCKSVTLPRFWT